MLLSIAISNFILIESAEVDLGRGLTVITGETGAGKSMVIQALFFGMGERADAGIIRHGCDEARVTLRFVTTSGELICDRRFMRNGKSRVAINGASSTVVELKQLMATMIDVVSQFDQQRLLNPESHLDVIDAYVDGNAERLAYADAYAAWKSARGALSTREQQLRDARAQEEFLRYQLEELRKAALTPGEEEQLIADRERIRNRAQWEARLQKLDDLVSGDQGLERTLTQIVPLAPDHSVELVQQMQVLAAELVQTVAREVGTLSNATADLDTVESRLFTLQQLSRKYKTDSDGLIIKRDAITVQLQFLDLGEEGLDDLRAAAAQCEKKLQDTGKKLSKLRRAATKPLITGIQKVLAEVGMQNATLHLQWHELPVAEATARGLDAVEFLISTNTGEPLLPMAQIASGGELSRILLALKCVVQPPPSPLGGEGEKPRWGIAPFRGKGEGEVSVFVFDEVDTGISGRVATAVGSVLQRLAARTQVLCITHLPQVAAYGNTHLQVTKQEMRGRTCTAIAAVPINKRREAIARLLSGRQLTDTALQHADELLGQAHKCFPIHPKFV